MIPCWNEVENIRAITEAVRDEIKKSLPEYDYEVVVIDNKSSKVKAIFNIKNFGQFNSPYYGLTQCTGDCVIPVCADFQDPVGLIPQMVHKWEEGNKVICMVKSKSKENKFVYFCRGIYYSLIKKMSSVDHIKQFTGFGLYDQSFIQILREIKDPTPFIRGIIAEYAPDYCLMELY